MKQKYIASALAFSLMLTLLSGCGGGTSSVSSISEEAPPEAFGTTVESTAQEEAVITVTEEAEAPSDASEAPEEALHSAEAPLAVTPRDISEQALFAVAYCDQVDQLSYDAQDPLYFWRAVGYLAGIVAEDMGLPINDGFVTLTEENVLLLGHALFADCSGEFPAVTEEDPLVSRGENNTYMIHIFDVSDLTADFAYGEDGSSCSISMTLRGQPVAETLTITTVPFTGADAGAAWFPRSISGAEASR
ncbi:MAG: hypothetical protein PUC06_11275 [Oscillospiraceae bacterium]|nr:hypothetical protein [Oscillospiraceae bacterium]